ncbi:hypothetical protein [Pedobacter sp. N23S346]|uniref:hypothetical protein n=1 Tax=Pedobacter sp. N23S346 TaxID=3402750 RepID=UPI003ACED558
MDNKLWDEDRENMEDGKKGEWKMGKRKMENGKKIALRPSSILHHHFLHLRWEVENGGWKMGKRKMGNGKRATETDDEK